AERKAEAEEVTRRRLASAAERLEPLLRAHAAAHAASGLEAGEECPICHRELPAGFQPPRAPVVRAAQEAHERAQAAARGAGGAAARARAGPGGPAETLPAGGECEGRSARLAVRGAGVAARGGAAAPPRARGRSGPAHRASLRPRRARPPARARARA